MDIYASGWSRHVFNRHIASYDLENYTDHPISTEWDRPNIYYDGETTEVRFRVSIPPETTMKGNYQFSMRLSISDLCTLFLIVLGQNAIAFLLALLRKAGLRPTDIVA
jgi:hypothetical protein